MNRTVWLIVIALLLFVLIMLREIGTSLQTQQRQKMFDISAQARAEINLQQRLGKGNTIEKSSVSSAPEEPAVKVTCPACPAMAFQDVKFDASEIETVEHASEILAKLLHNGLYDDSKHKRAIFDQFTARDKLGITKPLRDFGTNPTYQRVFDHMRANLRDSLSRPDDAEAFPLLGFLCTGVDFPFLLNHIVHIDNVVHRYVITVNGAGSAPRIFFKAVERLLPKFVTVFYNDQNEGVAPGWNNVLRVGFIDMANEGRRPPFVAIANADIMPAPGMLGRFCKATREKHRRLVINRFAHFAFFAVTSFGMEQLGFFDEAMYPAYGEDVEYHLRAVSKGLGREDQHFGKEGSNNVNEVYWHYTSINKDHTDWNTRMFTKFNRAEYIMQKWGVRMGAVVDFQFAKPYGNPFNNPLISHANSWIIDPNHRKCLVNPHTPRCRFDVKVTKALENKLLKLPGMTDQDAVPKHIRDNIDERVAVAEQAVAAVEAHNQQMDATMEAIRARSVDDADPNREAAVVEQFGHAENRVRQHEEALERARQRMAELRRNR